MFLPKVFQFGLVPAVVFAAIVSWINNRWAPPQTTIHLWARVNLKARNYCSCHNLLLQTCMALAFVALMLFVTGRNGPIHGPDSGERFKVSQQILDGTTIWEATSSGHRLSPLLPVVVAAMHAWLRTSFETSTQLVNTFIFAANMLLILNIVLMSTRNYFLSYMAVLTVFLSAHFRLIHLQTGEEPLYIFTVLCSLLFTLRFIRDQKSSDLVLATFFASASPFARRAGMLTIISFYIVLVCCWKQYKLGWRVLALPILFASAPMAIFSIGRRFAGQEVILCCGETVGWDIFHTKMWIAFENSTRHFTKYFYWDDYRSILPLLAYTIFLLVILISMARSLRRGIVDFQITCHYFHLVQFFGFVLIGALIAWEVPAHEDSRMLSPAFSVAIPSIFLTIHRFFPSPLLKLRRNVV